MRNEATAWAQLPYFLAVARAGSFRRAAEILGTSHLKIARHLDVLEATIGSDLVRRTRRGVELTEAGRHLLPAAEEAELMFTDAHRSLQGLDRQAAGDVRFSVSGPLGYLLCAPILAAFSAKYPQINLIIHVSTAFDDPRLFTTDVSLRMVYDVHEDAIVKRLMPIALGTFASESYVEEVVSKAGPKGEGLTFLGSGDREVRPEWIVNSPFPLAATLHNLGDPMMHLELANSGVGMTRMAAFMAASRPALRLVPGTEIEQGPPLSIIIHPELRRTVRVRRFVDFLEKALVQKSDLIGGAPFR